jgi:transcriptional regulator with XRE-family HTH domain
MATPREQLAQLLKQARIDAGYTSHAALAKRLNVSRPVITRAENPREVVPTAGLLAAWAEATNAPIGPINDYAERARSPRSWFARWAEDFEQRATMIRWFEPLLCPGLVQCEAYARATFAWKPNSANAESKLSERLARQSVLDRAELRVLILGSVLDREVGNASVMAEQIDHLVNLGNRPSVSIQIVPDVPEVAGALGGAFAISTEGASDTASYSGSLINGTVHTDVELITRSVRMFDGLRSDALPWTQTRDVLAEVGERWKARN